MKKINKLKNNSKVMKLKTYALLLCVGMVAAASQMNFVFADAKGAMQEIFVMIGKVLVGAGIALGLFGGISWAYSRSEGDGPGTHKAVGMVAAAAMLLLLSALLTGGTAQALAAFITTN